MKKKLFVLFVLIVLVGLVSAQEYLEKDFSYKEKISEYQYFPEKNIVRTRTTYFDYDNDNRYSTYDYKYGYSYRTTIEYRDKYYLEKKYFEDYHKNDKVYQRDTRDYYYKHVLHLREARKKECYSEAPEGKLFYIRCP